MVGCKQQKVRNQTAINLSSHPRVNFKCFLGFLFGNLIVKMNALFVPISAIFADFSHQFICVHEQKGSDADRSKVQIGEFRVLIKYINLQEER